LVWCRWSGGGRVIAGDRDRIPGCPGEARMRRSGVWDLVVCVLLQCEEVGAFLDVPWFGLV